MVLWVHLIVMQIQNCHPHIIDEQTDSQRLRLLTKLLGLRFWTQMWWNLKLGLVKYYCETPIIIIWTVTKIITFCVWFVLSLSLSLVILFFFQNVIYIILHIRKYKNIFILKYNVGNALLERLLCGFWFCSLLCF